MKTDNGKVKIKAYVVVSLMILLAVSVLAGTVYAVTLDITDAQPVAAGIGSGSVGDGEARPFNWTLDTSQDSNFKPVTNISGKLDGADNSTQNVTTTGYSGKRGHRYARRRYLGQLGVLQHQPCLYPD